MQMSHFLGMQFRPGQTITYTWGAGGDAVYDHGMPGLRQLTEPHFQAAVVRALDTWQGVANIGFAPATDAASADLSIYWDAVDGPWGVLGYANLWDRDGDGWLEGAAAGETVRIGMDPEDTGTFDRTILHEIGHALGLDHTDEYALMNPDISTASPVLTHVDIAAIRELYGPAARMPQVVGTDAADTLWRVGAEPYEYLAGLGDDTVWAGGGDDRVYGNQGRDSLDGGYGADTLFGGQDGDTVRGGYGDDVVYGNLGDDVLYGGGDADTLYGGQGNDILIADRGGLAVMYGGRGADTFVTDAPQMICDFDAAADRVYSYAEWMALA